MHPLQLPVAARHTANLPIATVETHMRLRLNLYHIRYAIARLSWKMDARMSAVRAETGNL